MGMFGRSSSSESDRQAGEKAVRADRQRREDDAAANRRAQDARDARANRPVRVESRRGDR